MFESIQSGLSNALRSLRGKGKLSEGNMRDGLELVRQALLEADVSYDVAQQFVDRVAEDAVGEKVLSSLDPTQQLVGIVNRELVNLMGPVDHSLHFKAGETSIVMLCGLQGSGKTTTCGKLGRIIQQQGRKVMLVAADLQRPAAIDQLHVIGEQLGLTVYSERGAPDPVVVCHNAVKKATQEGIPVVILDTAGRLHIDDELMDQLKRIDKRVEPDQVLLVVDGMTGQDAVNSAKAFNEALELDGLIMTKLDGDARGGAALSVKQVTGVPIKFIGTGEHLENLEEFHPDRMASRILGMGDMLTLVETAQREFDQEKMAEAEELLRKGEFTLDNFRDQLKQFAQPGLMQKMIGLLPGMGQMRDLMQNEETEHSMRRTMGIIDSMNADERRNPSKFVDQSRRRRIAAGAGVEPHEVNDLIKQFETMKPIMEQMVGRGPKGRMEMMKQLQDGGMMNPGARMQKPKVGTGKRLTPDERRKLKKQREKEIRKKKRETRN